MKARHGLSLLVALSLGACSMLGGGTEDTPEVAFNAPLEAGRVPPPYQLAICAGNPEEALTTLPARYRDDPVVLMLASYALEQAGHAVRARPHYERLAESGIAVPLALTCAGQDVFSGPLYQVAGERLSAVTNLLIAMDANLGPSTHLHQGLPPAPRQTETGNPQASGAPQGQRLTVGGTRPSTNQPAAPPKAPIMIARPASLDPLGQWFVHLASYAAETNANRGRTALAALYPALEGYFDTWQTDVTGNRTWRLGVRVSDEAEAAGMCAALKAQGAYCAVLDGTASGR